MKPKFKAVVFDSDGMLTHGPRFSTQYAAEHGISIDEMLPFFQGPFNKCLIGEADLKVELAKGWLEKWKWPGTVDELLRYWFKCGDTLDQRVYDTIKQVRDRGLIATLATNQEHYRTKYLTDTFNFTKAFHGVFSSSYTGCKKPAESFFRQIQIFISFWQPQVTSEEILFWDDDDENIEGARTFGFTSEKFIDTDSYLAKMRELDLIPAV